MTRAPHSELWTLYYRDSAVPGSGDVTLGCFSLEAVLLTQKRKKLKGRLII